MKDVDLIKLLASSGINRPDHGSTRYSAAHQPLDHGLRSHSKKLSLFSGNPSEFRGHVTADELLVGFVAEYLAGIQQTVVMFYEHAAH